MTLLAPAIAAVATADDKVIVRPNGAERFAVMPADAFQPEGIAVNPTNGNVIVGTFFGTVNLVRFSKTGRLVSAITIPGGPLLGLAYNPDDGKIYICSADDLAGGPAASRIRRIDADFVDGSTVVDIAEVPAIGAPDDRMVSNPDGSTDTIMFGSGGRAPNAIAFAGNGDLYFTDSFQGAVFRIADPATTCPNGGCGMPDTVAHDPLLATAGFPPFGANGIAFNADETRLFVANTGDDTILTVDPSDGSVSVLTRSINGADGVLYDGDSGLLWVAANQADQVVAIDPLTGRVVAEIGEFLGINRHGSARGLLFPASLARAHGKILVTNLAVALVGDGSEPEEDVSKFTVSFIRVGNSHPRFGH